MIMEYIMIPRDQMSIFGSLALSPCSSSGAMYMIDPALCRSAIVPLFDPKMPKSAIFTCMLEGAVFCVGSVSTCSSSMMF